MSDKKIFSLKSDIEFEAIDVLDACNKLSLHFRKVGNMIDSDLIIGGQIKLEPLGEEDSIDLTGLDNNFIRKLL